MEPVNVVVLFTGEANSLLIARKLLVHCYLTWVLFYVIFNAFHVEDFS